MSDNKSVPLSKDFLQWNLVLIWLTLVLIGFMVQTYGTKALSPASVAIPPQKIFVECQVAPYPTDYVPVDAEWENDHIDAGKGAERRGDDP